MAKMTGFIFQDEYLERLAKLSDQELGRLVRALAIYHATGEQQELAGRESIAYDFIKVDIDRIDEKYAAKCDTNRNNRQRSSTNDNERERTMTNVPKDKDKDKEKDIDDDATAHARETTFGTVNADPVIVAVQEELTGLTVSHYDDLAAFRQDLPDELVIEAINEAVAHGARTWAYVRSILQGYIKDGVKTVGQARERSERRRRQGAPGKKVTAQQYEQRDYSEGELEGMVDGL
jgi:DnaD/phage-associated family protein